MKVWTLLVVLFLNCSIFGQKTTNYSWYKLVSDDNFSAKFPAQPEMTVLKKTFPDFSQADLHRYVYIKQDAGNVNDSVNYEVNHIIMPDSYSPKDVFTSVEAMQKRILNDFKAKLIHIIPVKKQGCDGEEIYATQFLPHKGMVAKGTFVLRAFLSGHDLYNVIFTSTDYPEIARPAFEYFFASFQLSVGCAADQKKTSFLIPKIY